MSKKVVFMHVNFMNVLAKGLWSMYNCGKWTDLVVNCNGIDINVHKVVVEIMAPNVMNFVNELSSTCSLDMDATTFKTLMEYIYKGQIAIAHDHLQDLHNGATKLGLKSLVDGINSYIRGLETSVLTATSSKTSSSSSAGDGNILEKSNFEESGTFDNDNSALMQLEDETFDSMLLNEGSDTVGEHRNSATKRKCNVRKRRKPMKSIQSVKKLKCNQCEFEHCDEQVYSKHILDEHNISSVTFEPKKYVCYRCDFVCGEKRELILHRKKEHGTFKRVFRCQFCEFIADSYLLLGRHIQNNHSEDRPHSCPHCDYKSRTSGDLRKHMVCHVEDKVECTVCGKWLRDKRSFRAHMNLHTNQAKPRKKARQYCNLCSYSCARKVLLVSHLKTVHDVDYVEPLSKSKIQGRLPTGELQCKHCDYKTKDRKLFCHHLGIKHKVDEEGKPVEPRFQCKTCEFRGLTYLQLVNHVQFKHPKTVYRCEHCPFSTGHRVAFTYHMQNKHSYPKPFVCETCGVRSGSLTIARRHALVHSDEKFVCPICHNSYAQKIYLRRHIRIMHNADGPTVMCHMCPFKTRTNDALKQHIKRMHSDEKPPPRIRKKQDK